MLDYAAKVTFFEKIQFEFFNHMGSTAESVSAGLWRKIFWYLALKEAEKTDLFHELSGICLFPSKKVGKIRSVHDVIPKALRASEKSNLYSEEDIMCCYRSDYLSDGFIENFGGKYWSVSSWESNGIYSEEHELEKCIFEEFFSKYPDRVMTDENYPVFLSLLEELLGIFLPSTCVPPTLDYLKIHDESFLERNTTDGRPVFQKEFVNDTVEVLISFLRNDESAKNIVVSGLRGLYNLPDGITDDELYAIYGKLYHQPLMVNFNDHMYAGPIEYTILKSISLGFMYAQKATYHQLGYSLNLRKELDIFYECIKGYDEIFPYHTYGGCDVDVYHSKNIYVAGCYPMFGEYYGIEENANLMVPSLPDIAILQWADDLYDKCIAEKKQVNE